MDEPTATPLMKLLAVSSLGTERHLAYAAVEAICPNNPDPCCWPGWAGGAAFWPVAGGYAVVLDGRFGCCWVGAEGRLGATAGRAGALRRWRGMIVKSSWLVDDLLVGFEEDDENEGGRRKVGGHTIYNV